MYLAGLLIIFFGLAFLLRNLGLLDFAATFWYVFYPLVIIGFGVVLIATTYKGKQLISKIKYFLGRKNQNKE